MSMTAVEPTGINVAGKVSLYFVPAIANTGAPKLTEMNAVASVNLSKIVYAWDPNGAQAVSDRSRYGSKTAGKSLGRTAYDPAELEYDDHPQNATPGTGEYAHVGKLTPGLTGFLVDRRGLDVDLALAVGQRVDVYPCKLGDQIPMAAVGTNEGETLRLHQKIVVVGDPVRSVALVA